MYKIGHRMASIFEQCKDFELAFKNQRRTASAPRRRSLSGGALEGRSVGPKTTRP